MANFFDQVDPPKVPAVAGANFFDQVDPPKPAQTFEQSVAPENVVPKAISALTSPLTNLASKTYEADKNLFSQNFPEASAAIGRGRDVVGSVLNKDKEAIGNFINSHPALKEMATGTVAQSLGDTAKIATAIPLMGAGGQIIDAGGQALKTAAATGLEQIPSVDRALGKTIRPGVDELKTASQANYAKTANSGGELSPDFTNEIIDHAQSFGHKDPMAAVISGNNPIASFANELESFRDTPMTLDRATSVDQALTERLDSPEFTDKNGVLNTHGRQLLEIKNNLRDKLLTAAENGKVGGGEEGVLAYRDAVKDWAAMSQIKDMQRIIDRASYMDNPATALKTGFRNIAVNPGRLSKYPTDVQKAIKQAARDGDIANILRTNFGSRLISGMTGLVAGSALGPVGSVVGAAGGAAVSGLARNAAENMQMGRVNKVIDAIASKSSLPSKRIPLSEIMKMPPDQARKLLARKQ